MTRTPHRTCPPMRARIAIVLVSAICILLNPTLAYLQSRSALFYRYLISTLQHFILQSAFKRFIYGRMAQVTTSRPCDLPTNQPVS